MTDSHTHEEVGRLANMWVRFLKERSDSPNMDWHTPESMFEALQNVAERVLPKHDYKAFPEDDDEFQNNWMAIINFGDLMFHWGQYAHANGLLRANLTPCGCSVVTDEQIKDFFDGVDFSKGD
jgi:hypothetical protein